jgi:tetratricopeptide (TPR) repeat protein
MSEEKDQLFDDNELAEAVKRFELMLRKNISSYFDVHEFESIIDYYLDLNKFNDAFRATEIACQQHPQSGVIYLKKIQVLINKGEPLQALKMLAQIEQAELHNSDFHLMKGTALSQLDKVKEATRAFDQALEITYDNKDEVLYDIALTLEHQNHYKTALPYLLQAYEINGKNLSVIYDIAYCYERLEDEKNCISYYQRYLDIDPFSENVWYNLGTIYSRMEDYEKAVEAYDYAIVINEQYSSAFFNKANALASLGKYNESIEVFNELLYLEPDNLDAYYYIGEAYERLTQYDQALFYYRKVLKTEPEYSDAWFGIGVIMYHQEAYKESIVYIKKALEIDKENGEYWYSLGNAFLRSGDNVHAANAYRNAIDKDAYDYESWLNLADLVYKQDKVLEAIQILLEAYHANFDVAMINYRLSAYYMVIDNEELAYQYFEKGLTQDFEHHAELFRMVPGAERNDKVRLLINQFKRQNPKS